MIGSEWLIMPSHGAGWTLQRERWESKLMNERGFIVKVE
jgi:hypothetical protein